jgi:hypothetical protein
MNPRQIKIMEAIELLSQAIGQLSFVAQFATPLERSEAGVRAKIADALALLDAAQSPADVEGAGV